MAKKLYQLKNVSVSRAPEAGSGPTKDTDLVCHLERSQQPGAPLDVYVGVPRKAWLQMIKRRKGFPLDLRDHGINLRIMVFAGETQDECRAQLVRKEPDETSREGEMTPRAKGE